MYLIRKGEQPRPICRHCRKPGPEGVVIQKGTFHLCKPCDREITESLKRGVGVTLGVRRTADAR